jgi:hypothetical protein
MIITYLQFYSFLAIKFSVLFLKMYIVFLHMLYMYRNRTLM